jgi:putative transposase
MICSDDTLSIRRQTALLGVSRSSYYNGPPKPENEENVAVMNFMDTEYHDRPATGVLKLRNLLIRDGIVERIGLDRIRRLRRKMGLQTVYRSPRTTIPGPSSMIRPYLLKDVEISRPTQVWCTDITYIRMGKGYLYLTVIMDWYSRRILAWELSNTMETEFCIKALKEAVKVAGRAPEILNTDQGTQYTSMLWRETVEGLGIKMSMNGRRRWIDNVVVERFFRTIKYDEVYLWAYADGHEAERRIGNFIDYYNFRRPHQNLDGWRPGEVYRGLDKDKDGRPRKCA